MKRIPVDQLQHKTSTGLQIKVFRANDKRQEKGETADDAHRDDHYIFFLLTGGSGKLMVDLQDIVVTAGQLYYVVPSQVHYRIKTDRAEGWFLAIDTSLIPADFRDVFENPQSLHKPRSLSPDELKQYECLLALLLDASMGERGNKYDLPVIHSLVHSFLAMTARTLHAGSAADGRHSRCVELTRQFKGLLAADSHTIKSPAVYASRLNVSLGYLNEAVKKVTGATVSYWIQQELFSEAKRLLYHTDDDIKQIAQQLGYQDYSYFSRLFRKSSGMSPLKFRLMSRGSSKS